MLKVLLSDDAFVRETSAKLLRTRQESVGNRKAEKTATARQRICSFSLADIFCAKYQTLQPSKNSPSLTGTETTAILECLPCRNHSKRPPPQLG
jgi:hypothetical protein